MLSSAQAIFAMDTTTYDDVNNRINNLGYQALKEEYDRVINESAEAGFGDNIIETCFNVDVITERLRDRKLAVHDRIELMNQQIELMRKVSKEYYYKWIFKYQWSSNVPVRQQVQAVAETMNSESSNSDSSDNEEEERLLDRRSNLNRDDDDGYRSATDEGYDELLELQNQHNLQERPNRVSYVHDRAEVIDLPPVLALPVQRLQQVPQNISRPLTILPAIAAGVAGNQNHVQGHRGQANHNQERPTGLRKLLQSAQGHPYVLAGTALAATGGLAYMFKKPLLQACTQVKNKAQDLYRKCAQSKAMQCLTSCFGKSKPQQKPASSKKHNDLLETALVQLMASMDDTQLKRPGVETLLSRAWTGDVSVLHNAYFKALLRPDQKELLAKACLSV